MPLDYLGPAAAVDLVAGVGGIDSEVVARFLQRANMTPQQAINQAAAALGVVNRDLAAQFAAIWYMTDDPRSQYRANAGSSKTKTAPEFTEADAVRGQLSGHMLPEEDFKDMLAWSLKWFREATFAQMDANIQTVVDNWTNRVIYDVFTRMLSPVEVQIGEDGRSVGWAIGSGASASFSPSMTINVPFTPPQWQGTKFADTHCHYITMNASSKNRGDLLEEMLKELRHHGLTGLPFALVPEDDLDAYAALTGFVEIKPENLMIQAGSSEVRTIVGDQPGTPGSLFGYYKSKKRGLIPLRSHSQFPTKYAWMGISYGQNNPRNPIAVRVAQGIPWGLTPVPLMDNTQQRRLVGISCEATHGVGVNIRTNGVAGFIDTGASAYVTPELS